MAEKIWRCKECSYKTQNYLNRCPGCNEKSSLERIQRDLWKRLGADNYKKRNSRVVRFNEEKDGLTKQERRGGRNKK